MKILVTGAAGFIGHHLVQKLISYQYSVVGLDNLNDYYDVNLKLSRLSQHGITDPVAATLVSSTSYNNYSFIKLTLEDTEALNNLFKAQQFDVVVNLAAQAGVRYSITNPQVYINSNVTGFNNVLECSRAYNIKHLVFASSSSVYGLNTYMPFATSQNTDHPVSLYAATKKANELMAHVYSHLYKLPVTGLRFFTVYGPWGRPDMSYYLFANAMVKGKSINVYNNGNMMRDFTYVDDVVEGICRVITKPPAFNDGWNAGEPDPASSSAPYKIYNIGNNKSENLLHFIETIEKELGIKAIKNLLPIQQGDVPATFADISELEKDFNYKPTTTINTGIKNFISWYKTYYKL